jgi:hypothetical protein
MIIVVGIKVSIAKSEDRRFSLNLLYTDLLLVSGHF